MVNIHFPQQTLLPLILQEQECVPAIGELSPEVQEWSSYSPGHSSRHGNPLLYPNRPSVGELLGQEPGTGLLYANLERGDIVTCIQPIIAALSALSVIVGPVYVECVLCSLQWVIPFLWLGKGQ